MAEQEKQPQGPQETSSSSSSKQGKRQSQSREGQKRGPGLAPIQGEYTDDRPEHRKPGTREHLGEDPVYAGEPKLMGGETEEDARNR